MNDWTPGANAPGEGRDLVPAVDAAIERLLAATPLRRPSASFDARMRVLLEQRPMSWWRRAAPLAAAAGFALAAGFVAGSWSSHLRTWGNGGGGRESSRPASTPNLNLVHQESLARPAAFGGTQTIDLGDDGAVQTAPSLWIRTDRFVDPQRGVTIERSYPETWTVVGRPSTD